MPTSTGSVYRKKIWIFHSGLLLVIIGLACFLHSFLDDPQLIKTSEASAIPEDVYDCFKNRSHSIPKVVFMVIDAWRFEFLASPHSPMRFIRSEIETGRAVLLNAAVDTPTVTMPRIKAMVSGVNPSFLSLILNFFAGEWKGDSWVRQAHAHNRTMRFYGDDTWLKLFPDVFNESDGVTSFYVKDFTEVDNNVTIHLRDQLKRSDWDILILHYLGLDHIGHSLGGDSSEIPVKLAEMDRIAQEIHSKSIETPILIIVGDHGMTKSGSHGGGDISETRVPVVVLNSHSSTKAALKNPYDASEIRQIDVANIMSYFIQLPLPTSSLGISVIPFLQRHWLIPDADVYLNFLRHLDHWHRLLSGNEQIYLLIEKFTKGGSCEKMKEIAKKSIQEFNVLVRYLQSELLGGNNAVFSVESLLGILLVIMGCSLTMYFWLNDVRFRFDMNLLTSLLLLLPLIGCFASSFVEEEHDIWYYVTAGILFSVALSESVRQGKFCKDTFVVLVLHRIVVSVASSTRRRWIMDPDLLPKPLFSDVLWYTETLGLFFQHIMTPQQPLPSAILLVLVTYYFRKRMKKAHQLPFIEALLVCKAVAVCSSFPIMVDTMSSVVLIASLVVSFFHPTSVLFYFCNLVRTEYLLVLAATFEMGIRAGRSGMKGIQSIAIIGSAFFYMGNSNQISAIDIVTGYTGLHFYHPLIVAAQITLNMYAAVAVFLISYCQYRSCDFGSLLRMVITMRVLISTMSLIALCAFSSHLFVWSVFAPKMLFDGVHLLFFTSIYGIHFGIQKLSCNNNCAL